MLLCEQVAQADSVSACGTVTSEAVKPRMQREHLSKDVGVVGLGEEEKPTAGLLLGLLTEVTLTAKTGISAADTQHLCSSRQSGSPASTPTHVT